MRTRGHDDLVALLFAEAIFAQHTALVGFALRTTLRRTGSIIVAATRRFTLLGDQLVGGEIGKIAGKATYGPDDELAGVTPSTAMASML